MGQKRTPRRRSRKVVQRKGKPRKTLVLRNRISTPRRRSRKVVQRKDKIRKALALRNRIPSGVVAEQSMSYFLDKLGVSGESSCELDHIHKIDRLITSVRNAKNLNLPIGIQLTLRTNCDRKIKQFIKNASKRLPGKPLLYIEMSGLVSWRMARAVRTAVISLCSNPIKDGQLAYGLAVATNGHSSWFHIPLS